MIPKTIHRIVGFISDDMQSNNQIVTNTEFEFKDWRREDIYKILSDSEKIVFDGYKRIIQKIDFSKYIILKYYGGIYIDMDINFHKSIIDLYNENKDVDLFFEETTLSEEFQKRTSEYKIRNGLPEHRLRISAHILMSHKDSENIKGILKICESRKDLNIQEDYDILYTTGPDVVSEYFNTTPNLRYIDRKVCDEYFEHLCKGHWRRN
jgi:hypothetical protein